MNFAVLKLFFAGACMGEEIFVIVSIMMCMDHLSLHSCSFKYRLSNHSDLRKQVPRIGLK